MHISLDSALGRQRRLNSVGESVFQIAPDAAAGYSLRSLTGGDPAVVRVRRESDNNERDFNASGVSSGELVNWVNEQITPPLDLRELTATGRDGPIIEAAAAYSLRNLSDSYTGSVVDVRRSSDGNTEPFTAAEVADGTLLAWVNEDLGITFGTAEPTTNGATVTNASSTGFTYSSSLSGVRGARLPFSQSIPAGAKISITLTTSNKVGGMTPTVRLASNASSQLAASATPSTFTSNANGTQTFIGTTTDTTTSLAFFDNVVGSFDVSNVTINYIVYDGTVSKWYDQSTTSGVPNANHAVQTSTSSQPKIVDGGTLVSGGLDFSGGAKHLDFTPFSATNETIFVQSSTRLTNAFSTILSGADNRAVLSQTSSSVSYNVTAGAFASISAASVEGKQLFTFNRDGTNVNCYQNGSLLGSNTTYANSSIQRSVIGKRGDTEGDYGGSIQELIIYTSDQTDNRTALEANIGEVYGIAGIPAYEDTVNGFVETWYDQSGNGNDATQLTASKQPKIVSAGALVTGGLDFDGVNDHFDFTGGKPITSIDAASAFFVGSSDSSSNQCGLNISSSTSSKRFYLPILQSGSFRFGYAGSVTAVTLASSNTSEHLFTGIAGTYTASGYYDGELKGTVGSGTGASGIDEIGSIGSAYRWNGRMREIIIYPSDQSANREAIEANINNQYDIY